MKQVKLKRRSDFLAACLFLGPNFTGFLLFVALPVVFSVVMAFTNLDISLHHPRRADPIKWVWFQNFYDLFTHPDFWKYFRNTLFLMAGMPISIAGSLFLAVLLTRRLRSKQKGIRWALALCSLFGFSAIGLWLWGSGHGLVALILCLAAGGILMLGFTTGAVVYRTLFYLPSFCAGVAMFILWKQMYNPIHGPINRALTPILDSLANLVNTTSPVWWGGMGYVLWAIAGVGVLSLGFLTVRNWIGKEFGFGTGFITLVILAVGGLILYGLGAVIKSLPATAADGLSPPDWLGSAQWAMPAIILMGVWTAIGSNNMLLYIAGISNIPVDLYEAADIDGAGPWQRFWHVTWPQLAPTTFFITIMSVIGGLQGGFQQARTMTEGGPEGATTTISYYIFTEGFETGRHGYASAVAWSMFVLIFVVTIFNYRFGSRYVD